MTDRPAPETKLEIITLVLLNLISITVKEGDGLAVWWRLQRLVCPRSPLAKGPAWTRSGYGKRHKLCVLLHYSPAECKIEVAKEEKHATLVCTISLFRYRINPSIHIW